jgi:hypothetical protein
MVLIDFYQFSNGRTNGLAGPSSEAQAATIRQAYASAGMYLSVVREMRMMMVFVRRKAGKT